MNDIRKGFVAVAVEDDQVLMGRGVIERSPEGQRNIFYESSVSLPTPLPQGPDDFSLDWREDHPEQIADIVVRYIDEAITAGKKVDLVGVSIFGNVTSQNGATLFWINKGARKGKEPAFIEFAGAIRRRFGDAIKVILENDATAMALGEYHSGPGHRRGGTFVNLWIGRGVNGGIIKDGEAVKGFMHPEMGHIRPRIHQADHDYISSLQSSEFPPCSRHVDCLRSIACREAILARLEQGVSKEDVLEIVAYYVAQLCLSVTLITSPGLITVGGEVFRSGLLDLNDFVESVRAQFYLLLNGYAKYAQAGNFEYICPAENSEKSALLGITIALDQAVAGAMADEKRSD